MNHQNIFNSISAICNFYYRKKDQPESEDLQFWLSPAAGLLPGLIAAVFGGIIVFFMGAVSGGIIAALVLPLAFEVLTGWRGLEVSVACIDQLLSGKQFMTVSISEKSSNKDRMQPTILFFTLYLFRVFSFGLLAASGNAVWFVYVFGGAYLIRGELYSGELESMDEPKSGNWIIYLFSIVIAALFSFHWSAVLSLPMAVIGTVLILVGIRRYLEKLPVPPQSWMLEFFGYLAENGLLIIGLLLFGRTIYG